MTNIYTRPHGHQPPSEALVATMKSQLSWLSYHSLELSVLRLLVNLGYEQVSPLSRTFLRGRTNHAGIDMVAKHKTPLGIHSVVIQVKRRDSAISKSNVQQFMGAMECYKAHSGILITTGIFAPPAIETAALSDRPIQLIDGDALARKMIGARVGVRDVIDPKTGAHHLEHLSEEFAALERETDAQRRGLSCGIWGCD